MSKIESEVLQRKYRPDKLEDVLGQTAAVKSLEGLVEKRRADTFIFAGPSGTGKTTLSRIVAAMFGCDPDDPRSILEVDAAKKTGVDDMREVTELLRYKPLGVNKQRAVIVDECHRLSANAWDSLLKTLEEPPAHVVWFLCTTAPNKLPKTVRTRGPTIQLRPVAEADLRKLFDRVARAEKMRFERDIADVVIRASDGSPRQMLVNMALCEDVKSRREALSLVQSAQESDGVRDLCQFLIRGGSWQKATAILDKLAEEPPESVRIAVCNYVGGALRNSRSDKDATHLLSILDEFAQPYGTAERAMLLLSVGRVLFS